MYDDQSDVQNPQSSGGFGLTAETCRIHPFNVLLFVGTDAMLFGGEVASGGLLWLLSLLVAGALVMPFTIVQHHGCREPWLLATAKSCGLAICVAIPTAFPSALLLAWAGISAVQRHVAARSRVIDADYEEVRDQAN